MNLEQEFLLNMDKLHPKPRIINEWGQLLMCSLSYLIGKAQK